MPSSRVAAVDPVTIVIKECINLSTAIRKYTKYSSQSGVAALLSGGSEVFSNQDDSLASTFNNLSMNKNNDPFLSGFIQLRLMLNKLDTLHNIDSLTLLQPFLLIISTSSISGYITSLALDSLQRFFTLNIVNAESKNYVAAYREAVNSLTHCRFEGSQQTSDDSVLLKVVMLLNSIISSPNGSCISDSIMYDVVQTIMSLACNKRRTEVLRKAAEATMISITANIFAKLEDIEFESVTQKYINDESYSKNNLMDDTIGTTENDIESTKSMASEVSATEETMNDNKIEGTAENIEEIKIEEFEVKEPKVLDILDPDYGLPVVKQYLNLLLSLIVPENQAKHTNSTRIFGLQLINTAVEISGDKFPKNPRLFSLISDPIFKCVLFIIQNTNKLSLLQPALQLFTSLVIILGDHLPMQIELTLTRIFTMLLGNQTKDTSKSDGELERIIPSAVKELLIEQISILWTRSPSFFTSTFIKFDCNLDRADVSLNFLRALSKLSLPESAISTTESVPPICLEGLVSLIDDMHDHMQSVSKQDYINKTVTENDILKQRERKTEFIKCSKAFNEKAKIGIPLLIEKGFIKSDSDKDIASFLFENNSLINKKTIGLLLCDPKKTSLLQKFINLFDFRDLRVDEAIRILLTKFRLPGESQQIERIVEAFSKGYVTSQKYDPSKLIEVPDKKKSNDDDKEQVEQENEEEEIEDLASVQPDADSVFVLSYSIIMLNTDLHNPQVKEHMSFADYSGNLKGCCNEKDFPKWYLDRIYISIRDKEIVMPEEHHGNEKWFEDAWNNLISATAVMTEGQIINKNPIDELNDIELLRFDRVIFKHIGANIVNTFFKIYLVASDDHITSRMLTSLDKCAYIASFFNFKKLYNDILNSIAKITSLVGNTNLSPSSKDSDTDDKSNEDIKYETNDSSNIENSYLDVDSIPVVEITDQETGKKIPVSNHAVKLGRSFKAQLCTIIFFRIVSHTKDSEIISPELWDSIIKILLNLFENLLISPDIFPDLQQQLVIGNLPKPLSEISITKHHENRGLFSTFASYLKGDEEPTDDEINASIKAVECIQSSNVAGSIFGNENLLQPTLIKTLIGAIKPQKTAENGRYFEAEMLFLTELSIALILFCKDEKKSGVIMLNKLFEFSKTSGITKRTVRRSVTYKLLLISVIEGQEEKLNILINDELLGKNEIYTRKYFTTEQGQELLRRLLELTEIPNYSAYVLKNEGFWKVLRMVAAMAENTSLIYKFLKEKIINTDAHMNNDNFMLVLGLLDEISSIGAVGSRWEQEYSQSTKSGHKINSDNPYQEVVELSLKSINTTAHLVEKHTLTHNEVIAIVQALAHQCINPCEQIRTYALSSLQVALTENIELPIGGITKVEELLDNGLLTLLKTSTIDENKKTEDKNISHNIPVKQILEVVSAVYLYYLRKGTVTSETYMKVLNVYNEYLEIDGVEAQLQKMILDKKNIEKELGLGSRTQSPAPQVSDEPSSEKQEHV
ncbi:similar to Saccharomyces cerevisiae YEL022W GEA2 Guanine nucleotide exchange factor for ADP ribosylation factors (ARFs) [Maudiozyma barnettii]|uniref:Similar to Saccharomyces cerevisiae YEL022W GEA2 Guanine nucleotide exchange factor for ADP ribosylation factors (ARFs) n=1 Tax=Maudiozyma barnettii TaxID=61262 RepID=A0A8H2ZFV7_9SACH|nr:Arf family guanine nucleotide exchange factor GEA2 [Kazachstania barnettii]CAB4252760.1 similar to Saccharomyces cerevisiae YEL022W GEA2 Guanine nucleotide exchange factor for ADP ribosylation factors (ARFs) [Kazachstania barnettii]CAD1780550.1 similar to Saccharomyces cerevisiae YEL022W GEA2 Guanine nucleotide exchange factor for ADP ribosylation factors (ARFs) [Kazachstania barnettii]